jgi:hypothetical protein
MLEMTIGRFGGLVRLHRDLILFPALLSADTPGANAPPLGRPHNAIRTVLTDLQYLKKNRVHPVHRLSFRGRVRVGWNPLRSYYFVMTRNSAYRIA